MADIQFSLAVSRVPAVGKVLRGQVTGSLSHTDGDIIDFGPLIHCEEIKEDHYKCTDLNSVTIMVKYRQPPKKRLSAPKSYNKKPNSIRPNWRNRNNN